MPRENSFSDSDGRSLTPDLEEELQNGAPPPIAPAYSGGEVEIVPDVTTKFEERLTPNRRPSRPTISPKDRFRQSVRKIIQLHRSTTIMASRGVGAEPGVDPRRESAYINYGHIRQNCVIQVADYSAVRSSFGKMTNKEFIDFIRDPSASNKESWVKVRWINIGGISWDVISAVGLQYNLHPLSIEDVLHKREQNRSKVDYFQRHLFLRILCHSLGGSEDGKKGTTAHSSVLADLPRSFSPPPFTVHDQKGDFDVEEKIATDEERTMYGSSPASRVSTTRKRKPLLPNHKLDLGNFRPTSSKRTDSNDERIKAEITIEELKKEQRVPVKVNPMFIFLLRDGTVISMHPDPDLSFTSPITARLRQADTGLRTSADPSLLVQSLLDLIVDKALEVIDEYHVKIRKFEKDILLKPKMKTVRNLHILSGDLILHKRTLEPIKTIIYGLRRYDLDRCAALVDTSVSDPNIKIVGYMSHKSKIYLADVYDHMDYILTSLDMFAGISENLINYTFNMLSYEMNEVMRRLTLATIIFLPLTLLTGYFGMNFDFMWSIHGHSDVVFWIIALPVMAIVLPMFVVPDITRLVHYVQKKMLTKKAYKAYKQA